MSSVKIQLRKTSFVDYPGRISSVFFFYGCNLRCPWCHNRQLISGADEDHVGVEEGLAHLHKRKKVLGGVVLSGGEPCLYPDLPDIIKEIKKTALPVKLDTNGMFPALLEKLFSQEESRPDYLAIDLKIAPERYSSLLAEREATVNPASLLSESARLIRQAGIRHEYRTLALPEDFVSEKDIEALAHLADNSPWYFRPFSGGNCLDGAWDVLETPIAEKVKSLAKKARELGKTGIAIS